MSDNYYKKYLKYKKKYEKIIKKNSNKPQTWRDLEFALQSLKSKKINKKVKGSIFKIVKSAIHEAAKNLIPGMSLVSSIVKSSESTKQVFKSFQFNDYIFKKFEDTKEHKELKKILELLDIDDDYIILLNDNILENFMVRISNLVTQQSRNNPDFLNQEIPDLDEELIDFIWHKYNIDLSEFASKKNKKRRNKEFLDSDNDNMVYLKGLIDDRKKMNEFRVNDFYSFDKQFNESNFFLKNVTGLNN